MSGVSVRTGLIAEGAVNSIPFLAVPSTCFRSQRSVQSRLLRTPLEDGAVPKFLAGPPYVRGAKRVAWRPSCTSYGSEGRGRTCSLPLNRRLLRRLSYSGIFKDQTSKKWRPRRDSHSLSPDRQSGGSTTSPSRAWLRWQELNLRKRLMRPLPGRWATPHHANKNWWRHRDSNSDLPVAGRLCCRYHYAPMACSERFELSRSRLEDGRPSIRASSRWRGMKEFNLRLRFWRPPCWRNTYPSGDGCRSRTDLESFAGSRLAARLTRHVFKEQIGGGERI